MSTLHYANIQSAMDVPHVEPKVGESQKPILTMVSQLPWKSSSIRLRPDTGDVDIFQHVIEKNEYRLPDLFDSNDVIIDIGAHIGCFTYACLKRGAKKIYSYEAFKDNYDLANSNFNDEIKSNIVKLYNLAIWRSDIYQDTLYYAKSLDPINTGGGSVTCETIEGIKVGTIQLDRIIDEVTHSNDRIKLVKLDCEGSEFPILFTSKKLHLIDYICGEYHPITFRPSDRINGKIFFDGNDIVYYLNSQGFSTITTNSSRSIGLFFAKRKGSDNFFKNTIMP